MWFKYKANANGIDGEKPGRQDLNVESVHNKVNDGVNERQSKVDMRIVQAMGVLGRFSFDLSLARGLDYYTGVIYEAVFKGESQVKFPIYRFGIRYRLIFAGIQVLH